MPTRRALSLHDAALTPENHLRWLARFDALWSDPRGDCSEVRREMQALLALIERYEQSRP